ncbi:YhdP family protein [Bauldia litoralis]|uniref:AsmA-like C-terminal region n=1 Tax=Bauldia litoralis TaxID=665467 RepID=A0A1G6ASI3_9HYPH|nr:AsmA-like C-terminal domain-containing protein [Bauldia litoralis]SDB11342.1 AsmA-like C-terminal region [Bauldia litoralis]
MRFTRTSEVPAGAPPGAAGGLSHGVRIGLLVLAALVGVAVFVVVAAVAVVMSGPTELGFVRDRYEATLQDQLGDDYRVTVARAVVDVDPALGLVLDIADTAVADRAGVVVAAVPRTRIAVDPTALFGVRVSVTAVELHDVALSLVRSMAGEVYLGDEATTTSTALAAKAIPATADRSGPDGGFPELTAILQIVDQGLALPLDLAISAGFRNLTLVDGTITVWDAVNQRERRFGETDFDLVINAESRGLTATIATSGYAGRWSGTLERTEDQRDGTHALSGVFSQLTLADLFPGFGGSEGSASADIPLYGRANVGFDSDGAVASATLRLDVGAGVFSTGSEDESVLLDEATLKLDWDVANRIIVVEPSPVFFGETRGIATGWVRPAGGTGGGRYAFDIQSRGAVLAAKDANAPPIVAERLGISGILDLPGRLLDIEDLSVQSASGSMTLAGTVGFEEEGTSLALAASLSPMPVATLKQMWVPFLAPGARRWVLANITGGAIESGQFEATVPPGVLDATHPQMPDDGLKLDLALKDVSFRTLGGLPPVVGASGHAVLSGSTFGLDVAAARVALASGDTVTIDAGAFAIDDVFAPSPVGVVELELSGSASGLGEIADAEPLKVLAHRDLSPGDLSGQATAAISLRLPLDLPEEELGDAMEWKVTVVGEGLASKRPIEGRTFADADVTLVVTDDNFAASGTATIDGVRADVSFSQPLGSGGESSGRGQQLARLSLDKAAREKLGLSLDDILGGTVNTQISSLADGAGDHYDLDLAPARLTIPGLGWTKGIGVPATLSFDLVPAEDGQAVENIVLEGEGFGFAGSARIDAQGNLVSADIDRFALRPDDSVAFTLAATPTGYAIKASGASFDVRGVISEATGTGSGGGGDPPDIAIEADIARIVGFNGETLRGGKVTFIATRGLPVRIAVSGSLDGAPVTVDYTDSGRGASLRASAGAGDLLRFLDVYTRIDGGLLTIAAQSNGRSAPLAGEASIANFDILNEPAVKQAISTAPARQPIDPSRLRIEQMVARFQLAGDILTIDEALLRGQTLGATFSGLIDMARSQVKINGTYLPAYALNNAFGRVPLIGLVLGGGDRGGLIGVTFRVEGSLDGPRVYFNPLSAVAPGIFRKIFEFR